MRLGIFCRQARVAVEPKNPLKILLINLPVPRLAICSRTLFREGDGEVCSISQVLSSDSMPRLLHQVVYFVQGSQQKEVPALIGLDSKFPLWESETPALGRGRCEGEQIPRL